MYSEAGLDQTSLSKARGKRVGGTSLVGKVVSLYYTIYTHNHVTGCHKK